MTVVRMATRAEIAAADAKRREAIGLAFRVELGECHPSGMSDDEINVALVEACRLGLDDAIAMLAREKMRRDVTERAERRPGIEGPERRVLAALGWALLNLAAGLLFAVLFLPAIVAFGIVYVQEALDHAGIRAASRALRAWRGEP
jgi:Arc/MetJ family transcription regulator